MPQPLKPYGVFRGQKHGEWDWYVVDPAADSIDDAIARWHDSNGQKNYAALTTLIYLATIVLSTAGLTLGLGFLAWDAREAGTYILLGLIGLSLGLLAGFLLTEMLPTGARQHVADPENVMKLTRYVDEWSDSTTPHADIWNLNLEISRYLEIENLGFDAGTPEGRWATAEVGEFVRERAELQKKRVDQTAARVGFTVPKGGLHLYDETDE
ncbi:hypothetical protein EYE40_08585 [Glaciihabitans arcticus]|uniref:Uncharacterized protein n=1 Tax=Glaciihabitans arcticus TaxID=2668039 RepID=A0A4Q9GR97_9MICO|nr:hypothetical protein [Glaciihabitans arcticus]TBN57442.1 hypothetical protein EYE40_08585 [Glaciihabitans arcticus]